MICILNNNTEPYFNIAAEEYLLKTSGDDIFMLYRNEPSIIVGKHQNVFAEINYQFVKEKKIKVVRRLSGGGTVFHDMGNINFTFIQNGREGALVDFVKYTEPIIQALQKIGVAAIRSGRNDILVDGLKISGNAEHIYKNRTLHHGTLLFSSKLDELRLGLKVNSDSYTDKAVRSVRSTVTNITSYLKGYTIDGFIQNIQSSVLDFFPESIFHYFTSKETQAINKLVTEKYSKWEWNYGYSPKFTVLKQGIRQNKPFSLIIEVEKGIITDIRNQDPKYFIPEFLSSIVGLPYNDEIIQKKLSDTFKPYEITEWVNLLF